MTTKLTQEITDAITPVASVVLAKDVVQAMIDHDSNWMGRLAGFAPEGDRGEMKVILADGAQYVVPDAQVRENGVVLAHYAGGISTFITVGLGIRDDLIPTVATPAKSPLLLGNRSQRNVYLAVDLTKDQSFLFVDDHGNARRPSDIGGKSMSEGCQATMRDGIPVALAIAGRKLSYSKDLPLYIDGRNDLQVEEAQNHSRHNPWGIGAFAGLNGSLNVLYNQGGQDGPIMGGPLNGKAEQLLSGGIVLQQAWSRGSRAATFNGFILSLKDDGLFNAFEQADGATKVSLLCSMSDPAWAEVRDMYIEAEKNGTTLQGSVTPTGIHFTTREADVPVRTVSYGDLPVDARRILWGQYIG